MVISAQEPSLTASHKLTLEGRQKLSLTGVEEVLSFEETAAVLATCQGQILVRGRELRLQSLSQDGAQAVIRGQIDGVEYGEQGVGGGFFARLFR